MEYPKRIFDPSNYRFIGNYLKENGKWRRYYTLLSYTWVAWDYRTYEPNAGSRKDGWE